MNTRRFVKTYPSSAAARTARAHYRWLASLQADVVFPDLLGGTGDTVEFAHIPGRTAGIGDLVTVSAALGRLHQAARRAGLDRAQVNSRFTTSGGLRLASFAGPRRQRLHQLRARTADCPLGHQDIDAWLDRAALLPAALYKDANPATSSSPPEPMWSWWTSTP
ncbi:hypothetical protein [Saccharopolyspora hattusasensis]|uniref:hypothetical protein n=1 Tax=Saccharopolyspora hattusasensis TaxID=1128679 RepID=UPI003D9641BD